MIKEKDSEKEKVSDKTENKTEEIFPAPEETRKIGDLLCHERLRKGLDLEDVAQVLCIRRGYLEAIESGNYVELPPLPYSVGFVNSYAKYLGLNNTRIAQLFKEELNLKPADKKVFLPEDMASEASLPDKRYVIGGLAALLVIGGLWSCFFGGDEEKTEVDVAADETIGTIEYFSPAEESAEDSAENQPATEIKREVVADDAEAGDSTEKETEKPAAETDGAEKTEEQVASVQPAKIEIKISKEDTWVEVRDADKIYFNKVMHPGESYVVPEGEGMVLSAGKYDGVEVYVNDRLTEVLQPDKKMNVALDPFVNAADEH